LSPTATCIQVFAYIQTERAFLLIDDLRFRDGEPTTNPPFALIMPIENSGRNVAFIKDINITAQLGVHESYLPDEAKYVRMTEAPMVVFAPITPGNNRAHPVDT